MNVRTITVSALAALALAATACGSKPKTSSTTSPPSVTPPAAQETTRPQPSKTETATGELREALITLRRVHFPFDSATLTPQAREALQDAGEKLGRHPDVHIYVEGHADERGTTEYNIALADRRAHAVVDYLTSLGIAPERLHVVSYGEERPLASGDTAADMARNRRVEFSLMRGDIQIVLAEGDVVDDAGQPIDGEGGEAPAPPEGGETGGDQP